MKVDKIEVRSESFVLFLLQDLHVVLVLFVLLLDVQTVVWVQLLRGSPVVQEFMEEHHPQVFPSAPRVFARH